MRVKGLAQGPTSGSLIAQAHKLTTLQPAVQNTNKVPLDLWQ